MKTKLLSFILPMFLFTLVANAQTKIWDLGGNVSPFNITSSPGSAVTSNTVTDNLGMQPGPSTVTTFGIIETSAKTWTTPPYTSVNRWKLNGGGSPDASTPYLPKQRYLYFVAAGSVSVEILCIGGGSGNRTLYVTDGTNLLGSLTTTDSTTGVVLTTTAATVNGKVYIFGDQAINLFRIKVTGPLGTTVLEPSLATNNFKAESAANVYSNGKQVFVSNIKSKTQVDVYSINGALVKSLSTDSDTSFELPTSGFYIVKAKSAEGEKSVKISVK